MYNCLYSLHDTTPAACQTTCGGGVMMDRKLLVFLVVVKTARYLLRRQSVKGLALNYVSTILRVPGSWNASAWHHLQACLGGCHYLLRATAPHRATDTKVIQAGLEPRTELSHRRLACYSFKLCAHHSAICSHVGPGLEFRLHHFVYANRCRDIASNWRWHHNFIHKSACRCTIGGMLCGYVPCTRHSQFYLSMNYNHLDSSWPFLGSFTY